MFGATGGSSLFPSATTDQTAKRGLFDSPAPAAQPARPSPFAAFGSTLGGQSTAAATPSTAAPAPSAFSLLGGSNLNQSTTTTPNSAQSTLNSSIFQQPALGQTQQNAAQQQQQQQQQQQPQPLQGSTIQPTQPAFFSSLLEKGKKRPHSTFESSTTNTMELPNLQLGLGDIRRNARGLGSAEQPPAQHPRLEKKVSSLSASGISPNQVLHDLRTFDTQASTSHLAVEQEKFDPDNQKFLRKVQQRGREAMVSESLNRVHRDFDAFLEEKMNLNWDEQRQKIYEHFGLVTKDENGASRFGATTNRPFGVSTAKGESPERLASTRRSVFGKSGLSKSIIGSARGGGSAAIFADPATRDDASPSRAADSRFVREKIGYFGTKVQRLNETRLQEKSFPILHEFGEVEKVAGTDVPRQLLDAYQALICITGEKPAVSDFGEPGALRAREFSSDYLEDAHNSAATIRIRKRVIEGSRKYLEKTFYNELESAIIKNPREAQLGGVPTTINKIRAYIRLRAARQDLAPDGTELQMVNGDYCWILIFYLLRCGFIAEAAEYVSQDQGFRSMDYKFVTYMTTFAQHRRLPRDLQQKIGSEYQQRLRNAPENTVDPFRMACYKIIGRCDLSQRRLDGFAQGVEDWMWLQFTMAREDTRVEEVAGELFGLEDIKRDITEIGQRVFPKGQDSGSAYGTFFLLQILGGMFEHAVSYLGSYSPVNAVHFAIALDYYGLLRVSDFHASGEEILTFTTRQLPQINFASLIMQYTQEFRMGNVEAAVDYFTLICLNADLPGELGKSQAAVCHEALREFILETRDFAKLLGDIKSDGSRIKGAIERRLKLINLGDQEEFLNAVTVQAAAVADDKGLTADAVLLYHLAEEYDKVVTILNRTLSDAVAVDLGDSAMKLQPIKPRTDEQQQQQQQQQAAQQTQQPQQQGGIAEPGSSLSLTSVEDPVILARNMISLYNANALYIQKVQPVNRESCGVLLNMMAAKSKVESGQWTAALDDINALQILPLTAHGSISYIRGAAQAFSSLPPLITRNTGHIIMWSITCISRERERMYAGVYENDMRQSLADEFLLMAKDLMVFAGMVKYKLPPRVYETLAKVGGENGLPL